MGVSVVQRSKKEVGRESASISHVDLDEIYYIVTGEITTDSIGYLIFRGDPNKVMQEKTE
ncbi:MAG: hypothetical protein A3H44_14015 [Gammaproteobacteria bacterium RIFCSPLOWO2_02_FULL_57_10]|nr:MAG: hypothetical protein A3H44_14015 [Gammaproteobacteria bacterium RIFCSPLOWO2_02_FULL_57_10]